MAFLLSQTDEYIGNLTEMVKQHKAEQRKKREEEEQKKKKVKVNGERISIACFPLRMVVHVEPPFMGEKGYSCMRVIKGGGYPGDRIK